MKHLKKYENVEDELQIGDYVILDSSKILRYNYNKIIVDFLSNNIGKLTYIDIGLQKHKIYYNIPQNIKDELKDYPITKNGIWYASLSDILYHSTNKKDLELYITANKYNI
jgi:hypothetical protein